RPAGAHPTTDVRAGEDQRRPGWGLAGARPGDRDGAGPPGASRRGPGGPGPPQLSRSTRAASPGLATRYAGAVASAAAKACVTAAWIRSSTWAGVRAMADPPKPPPVIRAPRA